MNRDHSRRGRDPDRSPEPYDRSRGTARRPPSQGRQGQQPPPRAPARQSPRHPSPEQRPPPGRPPPHRPFPAEPRQPRQQPPARHPPSRRPPAQEPPPRPPPQQPPPRPREGARPPQQPSEPRRAGGPAAEPEESTTASHRRLQFTDEVGSEASIIESDGGLVGWARAAFGEELRVVGAHDENTFEILYIAEAVRGRYTRDELLATGDEFVMSHVRENAYQEQLYHLGRLDYVVQGFEDGLVIRVPLERDAGLIISFASTADVTLPAFVDHVKANYPLTFR